MLLDIPRAVGESTKDYLYRALRARIMSLELPPGSALSENEIVRQLDISRTPVREVLKRLENERLVEIIPQTGTRVTHIDMDLIHQVLFMRYAVEKEIVRELQKAADEQVLTDLDNTVATQEFFFIKGMLAQFQEADNDFHKKLYQYARKEIVWQAIQALSTHYDRVRMLYLLDGDSAAISLLIRGHREILKCIRTGAGYGQIEQVLSDHMIRPAGEWMALFERMGVYGFIKT